MTDYVAGTLFACLVIGVGSLIVPSVPVWHICVGFAVGTTVVGVQTIIWPR